MKKLNELNDDQKALIPAIRDEWIKRSLGGDTSINRQKAMEGIKWIYEKAKLKCPLVIFMDGPLACQYAANLIKSKAVRAQVWAQVGAQVGAQVRAQVGDQVRAQVRAQKLEWYPFSWCDLSDSGWLAFYDYFDRIGIKLTEDFQKYLDYVQTGVFFSVLLDGVAILCCRPSAIHKNARLQLHSTKGPAAEWPNGEKYWFLNGIRVNEKIVMHPEKLTKEEIIGEKNVDVRREMLRQIGMDRFCALTNPKVLDRRGEYELLSIDLSDTLKDCRFLKMKNPSIGVWHVEGVERECKTVQEAINWRAGDIKKQWQPIQLT